jgi:pimeloyl-ACP methyl ester carboxylesterase
VRRAAGPHGLVTGLDEGEVQGCAVASAGIRPGEEVPVTVEPPLRVERIADASHWVQADAPERVNQLMVDFLLEPIGGLGRVL